MVVMVVKVIRYEALPLVRGRKLRDEMRLSSFLEFITLFTSGMFPWKEAQSV